MVNPQTPREQRIKRMTQLYYSRPDIKKAIFDFSKDRETVPSYMMEGFGKRPDTLQYTGDIFEMVKRGATSFHCSEELWEDPLKISTDMNKKQMNELRKGWDLLLDIDSKYLDYSKIMVQQIIKVFKFHNIKNFRIKFSGSKGFHIIIPWKAFPKEVNEVKTSDRFPEWPRIITKYITEITEKGLIEKTSSLTKPNKYVLDFEVPKEVMPDLILVSPRHLFRMPYSLHEKTALASVVLEPEEIENFQPRDADPMKAKPKDFMPNPKEGEAAELLREALDWYKGKYPEEEKEKREFDFKPIKLTDLSEKYFPPSIQKMLKGIKGDGRKRALFVLMNLFRSIGMEKEELEKRIYAWNEKNGVPLKSGYIKSQLFSSYRKKPILPPNYDKDYYRGIGVAPTEEEIRYKNPVSYMVRKSLQENRKKKPKKPKKDPHEDTPHKE